MSMSRTSRVVSGPGTVSQLPAILAELHARRVFLVTGKASYGTLHNVGMIETALAACSVRRHFDFEPNPNHADIQRGAALVRAFDPDVVLAVGGGSVIDTGKLLSVAPASDERILEMIESGQVPERRTPALIAIPSTAGSGSEATHFAVVYVGDRKYSVASSLLLPDYCIVDSQCTWSVPPRLTAITALDALSQAVESYWATSSTQESREHAAQSIRLNLRSFEGVVIRPDPESRELMMRASHLAGKAINITATTAVHAYSYYLTKRYGIPHGQAVGMLLPVFMVYNAGSSRVKGDASAHRQTMQDICALFGVQTMEEASGRVRQLMELGNLPTSFAHLHLNGRFDVDEFMSQVNLQRLVNNPVEVDGSLREHFANMTR